MSKKKMDVFGTVAEAIDAAVAGVDVEKAYLTLSKKNKNINLAEIFEVGGVQYNVLTYIARQAAASPSGNGYSVLNNVLAQVRKKDLDGLLMPTAVRTPLQSALLHFVDASITSEDASKFVDALISHKSMTLGEVYRQLAQHVARGVCVNYVEALVCHNAPYLVADMRGGDTPKVQRKGDLEVVHPVGGGVQAAAVALQDLAAEHTGEGAKMASPSAQRKGGASVQEDDRFQRPVPYQKRDDQRGNPGLVLQIFEALTKGEVSSQSGQISGGVSKKKSHLPALVDGVLAARDKTTGRSLLDWAIIAGNQEIVSLYNQAYQFSLNQDLGSRRSKKAPEATAWQLFDVNQPDVLDVTPLYRAVVLGQEENVRTLLSMGADPSVPSFSSDLGGADHVLHYLVRQTPINEDLIGEVFALSKKNQVKKVDADGRTALHILLERDDIESDLKDRLLDQFMGQDGTLSMKKDAQGNIPLNTAIIAGVGLSIASWMQLAQNGVQARVHNNASDRKSPRDLVIERLQSGTDGDLAFIQPIFMGMMFTKEIHDERMANPDMDNRDLAESYLRTLGGKGVPEQAIQGLATGIAPLFKLEKATLTGRSLQGEGAVSAFEL